MDKAVVAIHQESDWAVLIVANRKPSGLRIITPFILLSQHSPLFAVCPNLAAWGASGLIRVLHTGLLHDHQREQVLTNAVEDLLREIGARGDVLQVARTGTIRNLMSLGFKEPLETFVMGEEPALRWLCTCSYGDTAKRAQQAIRLVRYLADRHGLDRRTLREVEEQQAQSLLVGVGRRRYAKSVF